MSYSGIYATGTNVEPGDDVTTTIPDPMTGDIDADTPSFQGDGVPVLWEGTTNFSPLTQSPQFISDNDILCGKFQRDSTNASVNAPAGATHLFIQFGEGTPMDLYTLLDSALVPLIKIDKALAMSSDGKVLISATVQLTPRGDFVPRYLIFDAASPTFDLSVVDCGQYTPPKSTPTTSSSPQKTKPSLCCSRWI